MTYELTFPSKVQPLISYNDMEISDIGIDCMDLHNTDKYNGHLILKIPHMCVSLTDPKCYWTLPSNRRVRLLSRGESVTLTVK